MWQKLWSTIPDDLFHTIRKKWHFLSSWFHHSISLKSSTFFSLSFLVLYLHTLVSSLLKGIYVTKIVKYYTRWFISHYSEKIIMSILLISSFNLIKKFNIFFVEFCCIISSHSSEFTVKGNLCDKNCEVLYQMIYFTLYTKIDNFEIVHFIIQSHWKVQLFFSLNFSCIISSHSSEFTVKGKLCDKNCEVLYQMIYFRLFAKIDTFYVVDFIIQSHWKVQLFFRWIFLYHIFTLKWVHC